MTMSDMALFWFNERTDVYAEDEEAGTYLIDSEGVKAEVTDRICLSHPARHTKGWLLSVCWMRLDGTVDTPCVMVDVVRLEYPDTGIEHPSTVPYIPQEPETAK